jgi:hypothetical protein
MAYAIPNGKNWRFGFVFKAADGTALATPTDTVVEMFDTAVCTASVAADGLSCLLETVLDGAGPQTVGGTTTGKLYSPTTLGEDGATPLEYNFQVDCAGLARIEADAGAEEAKAAAQAASAGGHHRSRR